jgi:hypothetical protein
MRIQRKRQHVGSATDKHILSVTALFQVTVTAEYAQQYVKEALRYYTAARLLHKIAPGGFDVKIEDHSE